MTANAMEGDREKCLAAGMNDHVSKPIDPKELWAALAKWIKPGERDTPAHLQASNKNEDEITVPQLPGIDTSEGLARIGGSAASYIKILNKFASNQRHVIDELKVALGSGHRDEAERLAHTIKGVAGNLGAEKLRELSGVLETQLSDHGITDFAQSIRDVDIELQLVMDGINSINTIVDSSLGTWLGTDFEDLVPQLNDLQVLLDDYDMEAEELLELVLDRLSADDKRKPLLVIRNLISEYDFEQAAEQLRTMLSAVEQ
jgi:HPt (histidine-containing phosphotransfer) domain-containing protein